MMFCAAPRSRPILSNEAWSVIVSLALGLSNGYFGSVPMITAPSRVRDYQKELTGTKQRTALRIMQLFVVDVFECAMRYVNI